MTITLEPAEQLKINRQAIPKGVPVVELGI